jgi:succinyl-CoA synthetase beta subunit
MDIEAVAEEDPERRWSGGTSTPPPVRRGGGVIAAEAELTRTSAPGRRVPGTGRGGAEGGCDPDRDQPGRHRPRGRGLDAKVTIDGNALFRHQDLAEIADTAEDPQEAMAKEKGLTYVKLDGNVGILANGAGLCMSTLDVVAQAGGAPANFLDAGGGSKAEAIVNALEVIKSDDKVTAILFNIFGGSPDEIANGIVTASGEIDLAVPLVVRLDGTNSEEGLAILSDAALPNLHQETTMLDAARRVVELTGASA